LLTLMRYSPSASEAGIVVVYERFFMISPLPHWPLPTVPEMRPRSEILNHLRLLLLADVQEPEHLNSEISSKHALGRPIQNLLSHVDHDWTLSVGPL
jgi:hypothetical protein